MLFPRWFNVSWMDPVVKPNPNDGDAMISGSLHEGLTRLGRCRIEHLHQVA
jgi:hypothetical protein